MKTIEKPCINSNCRNGKENVGLDWNMPVIRDCNDCNGTGYIKYTKKQVQKIINDLIDEINDLEEEYKSWEKLLKEFK